MDNQEIELPNNVIDEISWEIADALANSGDILLDPGDFFDIIFHKLHEKFGR